VAGGRVQAVANATHPHTKSLTSRTNRKPPIIAHIPPAHKVSEKYSALQNRAPLSFHLVCEAQRRSKVNKDLKPKQHKWMRSRTHPNV